MVKRAAVFGYHPAAGVFRPIPLSQDIFSIPSKLRVCFKCDRSRHADCRTVTMFFLRRSVWRTVIEEMQICSFHSVHLFSCTNGAGPCMWLNLFLMVRSETCSCEDTGLISGPGIVLNNYHDVSRSNRQFPQECCKWMITWW